MCATVGRAYHDPRFKVVNAGVEVSRSATTSAAQSARSKADDRDHQKWELASRTENSVSGRRYPGDDLVRRNYSALEIRSVIRHLFGSP